MRAMLNAKKKNKREKQKKEKERKKCIIPIPQLFLPQTKPFLQQMNGLIQDMLNQRMDCKLLLLPLLSISTTIRCAIPPSPNRRQHFPSLRRGPSEQNKTATGERAN
jgi:hypothetical protein